MRTVIDLPEEQIKADIGKKSASPGPRRCVEPWQLSSPRSHGWGLIFAAIPPSETARAFERKIPLNSCGGFGWMEVLVGAPSEDLRKMREDFLRHFSIVELDERVARDAIGLRQERRLKLPDAIGWASARLNDALLVTRNTKDFPAHESVVRIPYQV